MAACFGCKPVFTIACSRPNIKKTKCILYVEEEMMRHWYTRATAILHTALPVIMAIVLAVSLCVGTARARAATGEKDVSPQVFEQLVEKAYTSFKDLKKGKNADYIPILATIPSDLFAVVIVTRDGSVYAAGDVDYGYSIQSVSKPFTAALVMQQLGGPGAVLDKIGVEPTGLPFNSKMALEILDARSVNPLVNAGAIAAVSLVKAGSEEERWNKVLDNLSGFAGEPLKVIEKVYVSEYETAFGNRGIANLLFNYERLYCEPEEALRVYTRQCSVGVTTKQLAMMGATLANRGVNPKTGRKMLDPQHVPELLAIMMTAGFYNESGWWAFTAGLPAKTGVGGGIVAVVPERFAIAAFSPRLNEAGNSIRAMKAIRYIAGKLGVGVFGANPEQE
jgi:glutaminase